MKKILLLLLVSTRIIALSGMNSSPNHLLNMDDAFEAQLQDVYSCAEKSANAGSHCWSGHLHWQESCKYTFPAKPNVAEISIRIPHYSIIFGVIRAIVIATNTDRVDADTLATHTIAAVQKCQQLAGKTIEDKQAISQQIIEPWLKLNRTYQERGKPFYVQ